MPESSWQVFMAMQERIDHEMLANWGSYISNITTAYDTAYNNQKTMLTNILNAIIARQQAENALMATALSLVTGGLAGALGEGLSRKISSVQKGVSSVEHGMAQVIEKAAEDPILNKVLMDTSKDLIKKGVEKVADLGLDQLKGEPPKSGFDPSGMTPARYKDRLTQGATARCIILWNFVDILRQTADSWTPAAANVVRDSIYNSEFFQIGKKPLVLQEKLADRAELALWSVWALARDEDYWEKAGAMANYSTGETFDWAPLQARLKELGVPEEAMTTYGVQRGFVKNSIKKGLNVVGLMKWVRNNLVTTLFDGIPIDPNGYTWAAAKMMQITHMIQAAA